MSTLEDRLRASLRRHAQDAPDGELLAERIVAAAQRPQVPARRARQWRTWTFPLAAAAAVAVIAGSLVGVSQLHHSAAPPAATQGPSLPSLPTSVPTAGPTPSLLSAHPSPAVPAELQNVHVLDATFVGPDDGWLLAGAKCLNGKPGQCTAMLRTRDGGATWTSVKPPPADVPGVDECAKSCVEHIRFATASTGYAYGPSTFFMTTDGGRSWVQQRGGAAALESLDGNVIRVRPVPDGCTLGCKYRIETSGIGSPAWTTSGVIGFFWNVQLARGGPDAYVLAMPHFSGNGPSTLYRSTDDGKTWTAVAQPCRTVGGYRGVAIAAGGGDRVSLLCTRPGSGAFVAVSADGGAHFAATRGTVPYRVEMTPAGLTGDPRTVLLASSTNPSGSAGPYRSANGGRSWQALPAVHGPITWAGFESKTDGRIVGDGGRTIWTTHDAGVHWASYTFG